MGFLGERIISIASEESPRQPPTPPPSPKHHHESQGKEVRGQDDGQEDEERPENLGQLLVFVLLIGK